MSRPRAEKTAREVAAEVYPGGRRLPIAVEEVAAHLGLVIRRRPLAEVSGFLFRDSSHVVVGVNSDHAETRQRFTIAHEIGHSLLHEGRELILDGQVRVSFRNAVSSLATDREEIEANQFAAELLMPALEVITHVDQSSGSEAASESQLINRMAKVFGVSQDAMGYRLVNLGVI